MQCVDGRSALGNFVVKRRTRDHAQEQKAHAENRTDGHGNGESPCFFRAGIVGLGVVGFVAVTTLFSAMSARTTMGESLLPVLVFPLVVPLVVFGSTGTARLFAGGPVAEVTGNIRMLGAFAIAAVVMGSWLFRFVIEE